jgi:hypothetical protein
MNCLNCNAEVAGKYCQVCGQENIEVKESVWHLVTHFFNDITHFDGKFFSTLRYLIFRPGFVSTEYMKGRRASYLNPVRMYIFTSAVFFLTFFSLYDFDEKSISRSSEINKKSISEIQAMDSTAFSKFTADLNGKPMTRAEFEHYADTVGTKGGLHFTSSRYSSKKEYDSVLAKGNKKHNWLQRTLVHREIELNAKYGNNQARILSAFINNLLHSLPQMLFISLPLFALVLKLLYIRRKQFYYTDHLIYSIHLYIFVFIVLLIVMGLSKADDYANWSWLSWLIGLLYIFLFIYQYKSMRNFYRQGRGKTIAKFLLLNFIHPIIILILFIIFTFFSFLKI